MTWAFEVCSQSVVCLITVEDLNPPRQLLIKVVTGIFWAEIVWFKKMFVYMALLTYAFQAAGFLFRNNLLNQGKGVMEARNEKS